MGAKKKLYGGKMKEGRKRLAQVSSWKTFQIYAKILSNLPPPQHSIWWEPQTEGC